MFFAITAFVSLVAASISLVRGAAGMRLDDGDNGSCDRLQALCYDKANNDFKSIWAVEPCLLAAVCYERQGATVDNFLGDMWQRTGHTGTPPPSFVLPRVDHAVSIFL